MFWLSSPTYHDNRQFSRVKCPSLLKKGNEIRRAKADKKKKSDLQSLNLPRTNNITSINFGCFWAWCENKYITRCFYSLSLRLSPHITWPSKVLQVKMLTPSKTFIEYLKNDWCQVPHARLQYTHCMAPSTSSVISGFINLYMTSFQITLPPHISSYLSSPSSLPSPLSPPKTRANTCTLLIRVSIHTYTRT